jgi:hypothetical protein
MNEIDSYDNAKVAAARKAITIVPKLKTPNLSI